MVCSKTGTQAPPVRAAAQSKEKMAAVEDGVAVEAESNEYLSHPEGIGRDICTF